MINWFIDPSPAFYLLLLVIGLHCNNRTTCLKLILILACILLGYSQRYQCTNKATRHSP